MRSEQSSDLVRHLQSALARPRWAAGACILATLLGLLLSLTAWGALPPITSDSTGYLQGARTLVRSGEYSTVDGRPLIVFPPGYSALIAALMPLTGSAILAGRIVALALSTASIPLVFLLTRRLGSPLLATVAALLFALLPERVEHSVKILTDAPFLFLVLLMLLAMSRWLRSDRVRWAGVAGLTGAVAYLVRPEGAIMFGVALLAVAIGRRFQRRTILGAGAAALVFGLGAWPYVSYLHRHTGGWRLSAKTATNLAIADDITFGEGWKSFRRADSSGHIIMQRPETSPSAILKRLAYNEGLIWVRLALVATPGPYLLAGLGLLGIAASGRERPLPLDAICAAAVLMTPVLYLPLFCVQARYLIQPALLMVVLGAAGAIYVVDRMSAGRARSVAGLLGCVVALSTLAYNVPNFVGPGMAAYDEARDHAQWITRHRPDASRIVTQDPYMPYSAELVHLKLPYSPLENVVAYARTYGASLLLLPRRDAHPSVCVLAQEPRETDQLAPLRQGPGMVLFELKGPLSPDAERIHDDPTVRIWTRYR